MDENKKLSSEEQRRLMKEQYKDDLRQRKEFLNKVNELKKQEPILKALENMQVEDDSDEWIAKLNQKSAMSEAKMEMAMDSSGVVTPSLEEAAKPVISDEEIKKIQAAEMVAKMKAEMQGGTVEEKPAENNASGNSEDDRPARKMLDGLV